MHKFALFMISMWMLAGACTPSETKAAESGKATQDTLAARETRLRAALARDDSSSKRPEIARWILPDNMYEISGIALTADERLLAHDDQTAIISEIDYRRGVVVKQFKLGAQTIKGDFEGITVANDKVFLFASNGVLYEFPEGANHSRVEYKVHDTHLGKECEFEGVTFDRAANDLVLACKVVHPAEIKDSILLYRWGLDKDTDHATRLPVAIPADVVSQGFKHFHPSDITIDPFTGNYVLVASREKALLVVTPAGKMLSARLLDGVHAQPEGIAITKDSILIISDESGHVMPQPGHRPAAVVSLYRWRGGTP